ncbi:MAG: DUF1569 domain-containing protein [Pirellulaceae bacterium]|nr:DUF1569 domain-containing protein [Pirellulaceae bacterium]
MAATRVHRRSLDFRSWDNVLADIQHLNHVRYDRAGNWDLSQILEHVGEGLRTAVSGTKHRGPWIVRTLIGPLVLRYVLRQRRMKAGLKVPKWWLPGPPSDESQAINRFQATLESFQQLKTPPYPHPFLGNLSKSQWNELALIHASHHLSFLLPK